MLCTAPSTHLVGWDLIEAADQSLYTRHNGRNRVVWYQQPLTGEAGPVEQRCLTEAVNRNSKGARRVCLTVVLSKDWL